MDVSAKRMIVNAITFGRVPFVLLFMVLAVTHAYMAPRGVWLAVAATASLSIAALTDLCDGAISDSVARIQQWQVPDTMQLAYLMGN